MNRQDLVGELFPDGVPKLFCPLVSHFSAPGRPDAPRSRAHLRSIRKEVGGLLVPGSTGEGWEMSDAEILRVLDAVLEASRPLGQALLVGLLKTTRAEVLAAMDRTVAYLLERSGASDWRRAFRQTGVVGFTVCPPSGAELTQEAIRGDLSSILDRGYPTALYQLPQVTKNEMSPETLARLAETYPNFILFKDTSGRDALAGSGLRLGGLILLRGAEGGYASWSKAGGGPYDGFLLSTANALSPELGSIQHLLERGEGEEARGLSARLEAAVGELFSLAGSFPAGNAFANANKLLDQLRAFGARAEEAPPPLLYGGRRLPAEWVGEARRIFGARGFRFEEGYLN